MVRQSRQRDHSLLLLSWTKVLALAVFATVLGGGLIVAATDGRAVDLPVGLYWTAIAVALVSVLALSNALVATRLKLSADQSALIVSRSLAGLVTISKRIVRKPCALHMTWELLGSAGLSRDGMKPSFTFHAAIVESEGSKRSLIRACGSARLARKLLRLASLGGIEVVHGGPACETIRIEYADLFENTKTQALC